MSRSILLGVQSDDATKGLSIDKYDGSLKLVSKHHERFGICLYEHLAIDFPNLKQANPESDFIVSLNQSQTSHNTSQENAYTLVGLIDIRKLPGTTGLKGWRGVWTV